MNEREGVVFGSVFAGILAAAVGMVVAARRLRRPPVAAPEDSTPSDPSV